ncbi:MAG: hypothetical protein LBD82_05780 [Deltaproteobacteria bacterium]|jgi:23S rRNA pseudouridine1911/1915/1917 synthase|nr:hypothetical protein [Deltaproteobacteria bacterium]
MEIKSAIDIPSTKRFTAGPREQGLRLDAALAALFPHLGLRARRRLCNQGNIRVEGRTASPGMRLKAGQTVLFISQDGPMEAQYVPQPLLLWANTSYCAFFKPAGLASAHIAASNSPSAESCIAAHWEEMSAALPAACGRTPPLLCNRLDAPTSGLLVGAFSPQALLDFRRLERTGEVDKNYYALAHGLPPEYMLLDQALDTRKRRKTLPLPIKEADRARHTLVSNLRSFAGGDIPGLEHGPISLLQVCIKRGARHQIRAHLAAAGYPLVGDSLYGGAEATPCGGAAGLYLHHHQIRFMGINVEVEPPWDIWKVPCP